MAWIRDEDGNIERCLDPYMELLEPTLAKMERGSVLTPAEVQRITRQPFERLEGRIKSYFWQRGWSAMRRNGNLRVLTDDEEVTQAVRDAGRSRSAVGRGVHRLGGLDKSKLHPDTYQHLDTLVKELTVVEAVASAAVAKCFFGAR